MIFIVFFLVVVAIVFAFDEADRIDRSDYYRDYQPTWGNHDERWGDFE